MARRSNKNKKEKKQQVEEQVQEEVQQVEETKPEEQEVEVVEQPKEEVKEEPKEEVKVEVQAKPSKGETFFNNPVLDEYLNRYIKAIKTNDVKTAIKALSNIINITMRKFDVKNLETLYEFFKKYKDDLLDEKIALQGIETITVNTRIKLETVYSLMRIITKFPYRKKSVNFNIVREILKNEEIVNWFVNKIKKL